MFGDAVPRRNVLIGGLVAADAMMFGDMAEIARADAAERPRVYTREEWGARRPRRPTEIRKRPPDHIVVHHTASPNSEDVSRDHAFTLSREIQRYHMDVQHWDDIGEQLTISRGGYVMEGRSGSLRAIEKNRLAVGAHTLHHNGHTLGIENEGTYMSAEVPDALWNSLVEVCAWLCTVHHLDPAKAIVGHRDYNNTDCPGDRLYRRLPDLRAQVAQTLGRRPADRSYTTTPQPSGTELPPDTTSPTPLPSPSPDPGPTGGSASPG